MNATILRDSILVALGLCLASAPARAQYDRDSLREVKWFTANLGYGGGHVSCAGCPAHQLAGVDYLFELGGVRNEHIRAALTLDEWESASSKTESIALSVYYYPWGPRRLFLQGGLGGSSILVLMTADSVAGGSGVAFSGGLGFDLRLAHNKPGLLLKPRVGLTRITGGSFAQASVVSIGVGVQWER